MKILARVLCKEDIIFTSYTTRFLVFKSGYNLLCSHAPYIKAPTTFFHRRLREIDCSLAEVVGPASAYSHGAESGGKSICWPHIQQQSVFNDGWRHIYLLLPTQAVRQAGRQGGHVNERSIFKCLWVYQQLDCLFLERILLFFWTEMLQAQLRDERAAVIHSNKNVVSEIN